MSRPVVQPCGTRAAFARGCHCGDCHQANRDYHRRQRLGTIPELPVRVGPPVPGPWVELAACRGSDPGVFFPARGASLAQLRAICGACPVRVECLRWALEAEIVDGFWGGVSARGRRRLRNVS